MRVFVLYKIAKQTKKSPANESLQRINVPEIQKSKIIEAENMHGEKIERMVTPHTPIDALTEAVVNKTAEGVDNTMVSNFGGLIRLPDENEQHKKNYIKQLFIDNYLNNFKVLGEEDLV